MQGLELALEGQGGLLSIRELQAFGRQWRGLRLHCGQLDPLPGQFRCDQGRLSLPGNPPLSIPLNIAQQGEHWLLELRPRGGERWQFRYGMDGRLGLRVQQGSPAIWQALFPELGRLGLTASLSGELNYHGRRAEGSLQLAQGGFSSADGRQAGEGLQAHLRFQAREAGLGWQVEGRLDWLGGGVYVEPLYLQADRQSLQFQGGLGASGWRLEQVRLDWPRVGQLEGRAAGSWDGALEDARLVARELQLQALGAALLQPFMEARGWPVLQLQGGATLELELAQGQLQEARIALREAGLVLEDGRFALEGVSGTLPWHQTGSQPGDLAIRRLALGRLESGAFRLPLEIQPRGLALSAPMHIPFLGSELVIDHLRASAGEGDAPWEGAMGLSLYPVELERLTTALDLPAMGGVLSANLPAIRYREGAASLEGALVIQVFDGYLNCTDLRLIDPFGPMPRILADVEARHLDLGQLTQTFSFGQMTGFIDAELRQLEIAHWRPLSFDARIASSPGSYPRRISQKAVADITALGGGGAMAAVQGSFLRFFQDFGYRRIGLSCRLENGVCRMGGIDGQDRNGGYAIVEGGGIPALTVIGYNRDVHWDELVSRLQAAIGSSSRPVIK